MTDLRTVVVERDLPYPPERVWRALTTPSLMAEWLMRPEGFDAMPGTAFKLHGDWGSVDCEVLHAEPSRALTLRWDHPHDDPAYALQSTVSFTLTATPTGTRLRMEQSGFRPEQRMAYGGAKGGWRQHLEALEGVAGRLTFNPPT